MASNIVACGFLRGRFCSLRAWCFQRTKSAPMAWRKEEWQEQATSTFLTSALFFRNAEHKWRDSKATWKCICDGVNSTQMLGHNVTSSWAPHFSNGHILKFFSQGHIVALEQLPCDYVIIFFFLTQDLFYSMISYIQFLSSSLLFDFVSSRKFLFSMLQTSQVFLIKIFINPTIALQHILCDWVFFLFSFHLFYHSVILLYTLWFWMTS